MHPRNPYRVPPDFAALAEYFPALKRFVSLSASGKPSINFKDPDAQTTLTQALLSRDFNITLSLPQNRLCPTIPNRLNYILWIQDILSPFDDPRSDHTVRGLDVGTGASAIYPILACSLSPVTRNWHFVGTEIDPLSASFASKNVEANSLGSRITIWPVNSSEKRNSDGVGEILLPLIEVPDSTFDFTMCNPPFYGSASEIENGAEGKRLPPNAICHGAEIEMITPGGESAFVLQMVRESARDDVRHRCRWFTSMLGKLNSVGAVVEELRKLEVHNYALTQLVQGTTRRWAVAWSFGDERLPDAIARPSSSSSLSAYLPAPTTLRQSFTIATTVQSSHDSSGVKRSPEDRVLFVLRGVLESIGGLEVHDVSEDTNRIGGWIIDILATENTWSRAARRKRKLGGEGKEPRPKPVGALARAALHCQIRVLDASSGPVGVSEGSTSVVLEVQWIRGIDRTLFEGFWSHVSRKLKERIS